MGHPVEVVDFEVENLKNIYIIIIEHITDVLFYPPC